MIDWLIVLTALEWSLFWPTWSKVYVTGDVLRDQLHDPLERIIPRATSWTSILVMEFQLHVRGQNESFRIVQANVNGRRRFMVIGQQSRTARLNNTADINNNFCGSVIVK